MQPHKLVGQDEDLPICQEDATRLGPAEGATLHCIILRYATDKAAEKYTSPLPWQ